jgi:hypothetical protein
MMARNMCFGAVVKAKRYSLEKIFNGYSRGNDYLKIYVVKMHHPQLLFA